MKTFTLDDFLAELEAKTKRGGATWKLRDDSKIRTIYDECPLAFVMGTRARDTAAYLSAALERGMKGKDIDRLIEAVDWSDGRGGSLALRRRFLKATGLA